MQIRFLARFAQIFIEHAAVCSGDNIISLARIERENICRLTHVHVLP